MNEQNNIEIGDHNELGVSQQSVAKWESGKALPRGETLIKLAAVLSCSIDELLKEGI